ncbi:hypothetical protein [Klebsiella pneumoniae]|uniref:hypothetical protein n=1 Tax=Klebsiella pneumoniae TaxID=573 RepID=UPI001E3BE021|nr:hypothetical protein [Klebsiella pneumoniae]MCC7765764.1 hypothetical protein [Klebsiella pneumoniae]MCS5923371.1 hypothetical protein [Klebsiella pneumoniae subsp. pneumoniae]HBQ8828749.1 hypothetical protein [Klebsiella pneumoniae]HDK6884404.1 hypothetical protein [Klebsiella pneumoniae]HDU2763721.1 hypothetical protein [Klebsiella pneumoniae]
MTITLQAVNELIASLESAGELSIREQKFLKLAKAYQQLAAENVALKQFPEQIVQFICGLGTSEIGSDTKEKIGLAASRIKAPATDRIVAGSKADGVESGIKTIMTMLNHQAPGVSDAINVLRVHSSELREGADK